MSASPAAINSQEAIDAALAHDWEKAVSLNQQILDLYPENIDALNRIGFAYMQLGKLDKAKKSYNQVLKKDQYNQIAQKNISKLAHINGDNLKPIPQVSPMMFLEEPGKTKIVSLVNIAPNSVIETLVCGQPVQLKVKKHCIEIRDEKNVHLGALPDDVSFKLTKYIEGGNEYAAVIRSIGKNSLTVFIREMVRSKKFLTQPSFTPSNTYVAQGKAEDGMDKPDTTATGEENEEV